MNIENTQSQMRKGVLEYCILAIIRRNEAYPGDIIDEMKNAGLQLLEGTLYPLLNRLKNAEILTYRWVESTSGPPRKYFILTEKGEKFYDLLESTINRSDIGNDDVRHYCDAEDIAIILDIPDDRTIAEAYSRGEMVVHALPSYRHLFEECWNSIQERFRETGAPASAAGEVAQ